MLSIEECLQIRESLLSGFPELQFTEKSHKYTANGEPLISVSKLIEYFHEPFDSKRESEAWGRRNNLPPHYVLSSWNGNAKDSTDKGSREHAFGEAYVNARFFGMGEVPTPKSMMQLGLVQFYTDRISNHPYLFPLVTELQMYSKRFKYAGTADVLFINRKLSTLDSWVLVGGDYKGLDVNTPIWTTAGWKNMGTIEVGDIVYDKDGKQTKVIHTSEVHNKPCYKITFDTKDTVICDFEHKWLVSFKKGQVYEDDVLTTEELYKTANRRTPNGNRYLYTIPKVWCCGALQSEDIDLPIDPYVLGIWLGNGHKVDGKITNLDNGVWDEIKKRGFLIGKDVSGETSDIAETRTIFGLSGKLRALNLLMNKHLPDIYLKASSKQRLDLLRGLMDSDGYYHKTRNRCVMNTTQSWQAEAVSLLVASLGWKPTSIPCKASYGGKIFNAINVCFKPTVNPFLVRNKDASIEDTSAFGHDISRYRKIDKIEKVECVPTRCIAVDSPSHTYLFGESFIVTHNTNDNIFNKAYSNLIQPGLLDRPNNNYQHYTVQLSMYQIMLEERFNCAIQQRIIIWLKKDSLSRKLYQVHPTDDVTAQCKVFLKSGVYH